MQPSTKLPDNFKSRLSRVYFAQRSFTDDSGKSIAYERLVLEVLIKDKPFNLEFKISDKDKAIVGSSRFAVQRDILSRWREPSS